MLEQISKLLTELGIAPDAAREAHLSLEIAALLGPVVYTDEWCVACEMRGVETCEDLVDVLVIQGRATRQCGGWKIEDPSLVEDLVGYVRSEEGWRSHHFTCANALFAVAPPHRSGVARRRAAHLIEAFRLEEALEPLLEAEKEAYGNGDFENSRGHLDTRARLLDELGTDNNDPRRAQNDWRRAKLLQVHGQRAKALALVDKSRRLLQSTDWASERGHAALLHGQMLRDEGRFDDARQCFDRASRHYASGGDDAGLASSRAHLGFLEMECGQPERARGFYEEALRVFEQLEDSFMISSMWCQMSHAWLIRGNHAQASRCAERARQIAHDAGHKSIEGSAWTAFGEIARDAGHWSEARACYERSIERADAANDRNVHVIRYNLALVEVGAGEYAAAKALFADVKERFSELGFVTRAPLVNAGLMACSAAEADWEGFERFHRLVSQSIDQLGLGDTELVWLADKAASLAEAHGRANAQKMAKELEQVLSQVGRVLPD